MPSMRQQVQPEQQVSAAEQSRVHLLRGLVCQIWPLLFGNMMQWYEFAIFGYLSPQITNNFFPGSRSTTWLLFSLTFVGRPFGGLVFGWLADHSGRRHSTVLSLVGMLVATVAQGLLPSSYCCGNTWGGLGVGLLVVCRLMQGVCTGGDEAAVCPYIVESAPSRLKCSAGGVFQITASLGFMLASLVVFSLNLALGPDAMVLWGWRLPFVCALFPGSVTLWGRRNLPESPEFLAWKEQTTQRKAEQVAEVSGNKGVSKHALSALNQQGLNALVLFFGVAQTSFILYLAMWCVTHAEEHGLAQGTAMGINSLMQLVSIVVTAVASAMSDKRGKGPHLPYLMANVCALVGVFPLYATILAHVRDPMVVGLCVVLGFGVLLGLNLACVTTFLLDLFQTHCRGRVFGFTMNLSVSLWGGFCGVISEKLLALSPHGPVIYGFILGCTSCSVLGWAGWAHARGYLNIRHLTSPDLPDAVLTDIAV